MKTFKVHYINEEGMKKIESILLKDCKWFQGENKPTQEMIYAWAKSVEDDFNANPDLDFTTLEIRSFDHLWNRTCTYRLDKSCFEVRIEEC